MSKVKSKQGAVRPNTSHTGSLSYNRANSARKPSFQPSKTQIMNNPTSLTSIDQPPSPENTTFTPSKSLNRTTKGQQDSFTTTLEGFKHLTTPSMASSKYGDLSTKAGTMTTLPKFRVRTIMTPQSLSNLPMETGKQTSIEHLRAFSQSKPGIRSLNDVDTKRGRVHTEITYTESGIFTDRDEPELDFLRSNSIEINDGGTLDQIQIEPFEEEEEEILQRSINNMKELKESEEVKKNNSSMKLKKAATIVVDTLQKEQGQVLKVKRQSSKVMKKETKEKLSASCLRESMKKSTVKTPGEKKKVFSLVVMKKKSSAPKKKGRKIIQKQKSGESMTEDAKVSKTVSEAIGSEEIPDIEEKMVENVEPEVLAVEKKEDIVVQDAKVESPKISIAPEEDEEVEDIDVEEIVEDNKQEGKEAENLVAGEEAQEQEKEEPVKDVKIPEKGLDWLLGKLNENREEPITLTNRNKKVLETIYARNKWRMVEEEAVDPSQSVKQEQHVVFKQGHTQSFFDWNADNKYMKQHVAYNNFLPAGIVKDAETIEQRDLNKEKRNNTTTKIVRYFDQFDPVVIQPKFMEVMGSMCVTELWGNKNKNQFYINMRKNLPEEVQVCLDTHSGVYRPTTSLDSEALKRRREANGGLGTFDLNAIKKTIVLSSSNTGRLSPKGATRHTRSFVLQSARPKTAMSGSYSKRTMG